MFPFVYLLTVLCCGASGHPAPTAASPIPAPDNQVPPNKSSLIRSRSNRLPRQPRLQYP